MNKVRCTNSHWYDADVYAVCPHCGAKKMLPGQAISQETSQKSEKSVGKTGRKGLFGKKSVKPQEIGTTGGVQQSVEASEQISEEENREIYEVNPVPQSKERDEKRNSEELPKTGVMMKPVDFEDPKIEVDYAPVRRDLEDIKTTSVYANKSGEEPVTGWLVGVKGEYKGESFPLKTGVSVIGRDASAYVCLKKDTSVSRDRHASVIYEPKKKVFYLKEGDGSLTYCNDTLVDGKIEIKAYDSIEIGNGVYLFMPFCGEQFDWDKQDEENR